VQHQDLLLRLLDLQRFVRYPLPVPDRGGEDVDQHRATLQRGGVGRFGAPGGDPGKQVGLGAQQHTGLGQGG